MKCNSSINVIAAVATRHKPKSKRNLQNIEPKKILNRQRLVCSFGKAKSRAWDRKRALSNKPMKKTDTDAVKKMQKATQKHF